MQVNPDNIQRFAQGERVGNYEILQCLGRKWGGFAYLARDTRCSHVREVLDSRRTLFTGYQARCGCPVRTVEETGYVRWNWAGPRGGQVKVFEHRIIMESLLGRELLAHEQPHHKNGVKSDNRPENLELWSTAQPCGQRVEDKTAWAVAWLRQYAPEMLVS